MLRGRTGLPRLAMSAAARSAAATAVVRTKVPHAGRAKRTSTSPSARAATRPRSAVASDMKPPTLVDKNELGALLPDYVVERPARGDAGRGSALPPLTHASPVLRAKAAREAQRAQIAAAVASTVAPAAPARPLRRRSAAATAAVAAPSHDMPPYTSKAMRRFVASLAAEASARAVAAVRPAAQSPAAPRRRFKTIPARALTLDEFTARELRRRSERAHYALRKHHRAGDVAAMPWRTFLALFAQHSAVRHLRNVGERMHVLGTVYRETAVTLGPKALFATPNAAWRRYVTAQLRTAAAGKTRAARPLAAAQRALRREFYALCRAGRPPMSRPRKVWIEVGAGRRRKAVTKAPVATAASASSKASSTTTTTSAQPWWSPKLARERDAVRAAAGTERLDASDLMFELACAVEESKHEGGADTAAAPAKRGRGRPRKAPRS